MILAMLAKRLRAKTEATKRFNNNRLYRQKKKAFYTKINSEGTKKDVIADPPTKEDISEFWGGLWSSKGGHNLNAQWLKDEKKEMENKPKAVWTNFNLETLTLTTKKISNWKAPGLDQVQNFWIKHLVALHPALVKVSNLILTQPESAPPWLTNGKTTLLHKDGDTSDAKNYRPITCLPTYYKLITLMLTDKVYQHVTENSILPPEQKGIMRGARG